MKISHRLFLGLFVFLFAVGMTWLFWWPLWNGGGLIGGDLYPYYFPQKAFLADSLQAGIIPLWNPLVGFGYPTLGESQTGVLYPPNLILYSQFSLNTAYNISQLLHYIIAFIASWALARRLGLSTIAALFAATVFVYGWFPSRICLEWAIIGGAWFAAILWAATVYLQTQKWWALTCIALFLGMDLLAGHYHLAFATIIVLVKLPFILKVKSIITEKCYTIKKLPFKDLAVVLLMVIMGFLMAAVQLIPSWELKSLSQRQEVNEVFTPTYGHLPPKAISQLWLPWKWYSSELPMDRLLEQADWLSVPNSTNQVEASLYCGLLSLILIVLACLWRSLRIDAPLVGFWRWIWLAIFGLVMATGWPTHYLSWVPGIGFFRGPGRYSMITAIAVALLSASILDGLFQKFQFRPARAWVTGMVCLTVLVADLWLASRQYQLGAEPYLGRQVFYATMVDHPPINFRDQSQLKNYFAEKSDEVRLYAPGQNVPTLLGVSAIPVYLGLGPEIYESDQFRIDFSKTDQAFISENRKLLREFGVTHLLLEQQIDHNAWDLTFLGPQYDELLNRALGRNEPFYFYEMNDALGRASTNSKTDHNELKTNIESTPNQVVVSISADQEMHDMSVTLRDLNYPGWEMANDFQANNNKKKNLFRYGSKKTKHPQKSFTFKWCYAPWSVKLGAVFSVLGIILLTLIPIYFQRRTHPEL